MRFHYFSMCALVGIASFAFAADRPAALPTPDDPKVAVRPTHYQSALPYSNTASETTSPAQNWKVLNQAVGSYDSMALTMGAMLDQKIEPVAQSDAGSVKDGVLPNPQSMKSAPQPQTDQTPPAVTVDPHAQQHKTKATK